MRAEKPTLDTMLNDQVDRLAAEFTNRYPREEIERYARLSLAQFEGARVTDFIPIFVYRDVKLRLRDQANRQN